ncbi:MAG: chromate transporter [Lentisphaeria bacterium]
MTYWQIFTLFFKFGLLSIGGGYVLVPLFQSELINKYQIMTEQQFGNIVAIAQMTPGPIGINTTTFGGYLAGGIIGGIIASIALITPSLIMVPITVHSLKKWENSLIVKGILTGIRPAAYGLLAISIALFFDLAIIKFQAIYHLILKQPQNHTFIFRPINLAIAIAAAICISLGKLSIVKILIIAGLIGATNAII